MVNGEVGGGNKVLLEIAQRLSELGQDVELYFWDARKTVEWHSTNTRVSTAQSLEEALKTPRDFVYFSNSFLLPLGLPYLNGARPVLVCQGYESFCYGDTFEESRQDCPALVKVMQLPISIISTSKSIQSLIKQRANRDSFFVPVGIDKALFNGSELDQRPDPATKRILLVGNYLLPFKGMFEAFKAIEMLSREISVQLVLITQARSGRHIFERFSFAHEIHYQPKLDTVASIFKSCHVYCCASWYEGLGLPSLEAFCCGVPVVSTRDFGVNDFGIDGVNLLLAQPNDPADLYSKLKTVLSDDSLANVLRHNAFKTAAEYDWNKSIQAFIDCQKDLLETKPEPAQFTVSDMSLLSKELDAEGLFTPAETYQKLRDLYGRVDSICTTILDGELDSKSLFQLSETRKELSQYLSNPKAEYYKAFKARYDACGLLLTLKDEPDFRDYVKAISRTTSPLED